MGRLRSTLRSYALQRHDPAEVLELADRKLQRFAPDVLATVLLGVSFVPYATLRLASAGHLPPALATEGHPPSFVDVPLGPALGVVPHVSRASVAVALPTGAALLAYTDGLVERPGEVLDAGLERLLGAVRPAPPEALCDEVMAALLAGTTPRDDIAVLALRRLAR